MKIKELFKKGLLFFRTLPKTDWCPWLKNSASPFSLFISTDSRTYNRFRFLNKLIAFLNKFPLKPLIMSDEDKIITKSEGSYYSRDKKKEPIKSPDLSKMQMVEIDKKTKIYIAIGASVDDARTRYSDYLRVKKKI